MKRSDRVIDTHVEIHLYQSVSEVRFGSVTVTKSEESVTLTFDQPKELTEEKERWALPRLFGLVLKYVKLIIAVVSIIKGLRS
jgi:hypothetical protein